MKKIICVLSVIIFAFNMVLPTFIYAEESAATAAATKAAIKAPVKAAPAEENGVPAEEGGQPQKTLQDMPRADILERLETLLNYHTDIAGSIQGIARAETENGNIITYNGVSLDQLDKETLIALLQQVNGLLNQKNLEKLQRQMKNLRQIDQINRTNRMLRNQRNLQQMQNFNRQQRQLRELNKRH